MKIPVAGFDPSLDSWGIATGLLDLQEGFLSDLELAVVETAADTRKQVRVNSSDLARANILAESALRAARNAKAVFVEIPVGSQSARGMAAYGICVGILGVIRAEGIPLIEVTATEVKRALHGSPNATKKQMIQAAVDTYPDASFPSRNGKILAKTEHTADAIGAIHAGVITPVFQQLMRILEKVN